MNPSDRPKATKPDIPAETVEELLRRRDTLEYDKARAVDAEKGLEELIRRHTPPQS